MGRTAAAEVSPNISSSNDREGCRNPSRTTPADCTEISASESRLTGIIQPPEKPETEWEKANWDKVLKGREIVLDTYELLGPVLVSAKLHCGSCHLNAGGNPDAAWFVNMEEKYKTRQKLQERINKCFDKSMNGVPVCDSGNGECDKNPVMDSLITYMEWLTLEWKKEGLPAATHVFPGLPALEGNPDRGKEIFMQKCSVCHNTDAEGIYVGGAYFRPALAGPDSFNACAGMAKPETLAGFIKSNMPFGNGGSLTAWEAWDLAAFIDGKCRPGKGKDRYGNICSGSRTCRNGKPVNE